MPAAVGTCTPWGVGEHRHSAVGAFLGHFCCPVHVYTFTTANLAVHRIVAEVNSHISCSFDCLFLLLFSFGRKFKIIFFGSFSSNILPVIHNCWKKNTGFQLNFLEAFVWVSVLFSIFLYRLF